MKTAIYLYNSRWFKFGTSVTFFLLFVIWIGNFWLLPGLAIVYDIYISKKVNWTFWKKRGITKKSVLIDWIDSLIYAGIAAILIRMFLIEAYAIPTPSMEKSMLVGDYLFVSKISYGPRLPNTPLAVPFVHHTLPFTKSTPSFLEWISLPYKRLAGLGEIKNNDVVVFNFPEGDTVASNIPEMSYYELCREFGRNTVLENKLEKRETREKLFGEIVVRPVDKKENYVKRCVAIAGDTLKIINGQLFINSQLQEISNTMQYKYLVKTNGNEISKLFFEKCDITPDDYKNFNRSDYSYELPLTKLNVVKISKLSNVVSVTRITNPKDLRDKRIFPHDALFNWNEDNFGPIVIPKHGMTIKLNVENLLLYKRIISVYENNKLEIKLDGIYINNCKTEYYTFKMDYYFMMGDNRNNSVDSRYWGFVPEDHIVGKPVFVWASFDKDKNIPDKIRMNRFFTSVR